MSSSVSVIPIKPLPSDVAAKIESSTSITQLNEVIVELAKNSLDARAHAIHVSVDFKRGSCIVEDDGNGIPPAEFEPAGGLGRAHHTSKFQRTGAYGHRGLFLASLAALSLLTVTSRHIYHRSTNCVIFHQSRVVARLVPAPAHQALRMGEHGTCVTVNDLFGNMPVRVKSRALSFEKADELDREWDNLRYTLVSLMLANPRLSRLVISDVGRGKRISIRPGSLSPVGDDHVGSAVNGFSLNRLNTILSQSGMLDSGDMKSWHIISATVPDISIDAMISTMPSPSKRIQFISLNNEPVLPRDRSNVLFSEINRLMLLSDFGNTEATSRTASITCPSATSHSDCPDNVSGRGWVKPINKWPMFYVYVDTGYMKRLVDTGRTNSPDSGRSLQRITNVIGAMILEFLKQQGMRPRISRRPVAAFDHARRSLNADRKRFTGTRESLSSTDESFSHRLKMPSFHRSQTANVGQNFHDWSRVKAAKGPGTAVSSNEILIQNQSSALGGNRVREGHHDSQRHFQRCHIQRQHSFVQSNPLRKTLGESDTPGLPTEACCNGVEGYPADILIPWKDPRIGKTYMINSRTGQTVVPGCSRDSIAPIARGRLNDRPADPRSTYATWVDNVLQTWDNPVFGRTEVPVLSLDLGATLLGATTSHTCPSDITSLDTAHVARFKGKIRRADLESARVIAQVNHQFVLTRIYRHFTKSEDDDLASVLVLVDQHAADERCRVEQLFREMFTSSESHQTSRVRTTEVEPITFKVSSIESTLLQKYSSFFGYWGIQYIVTLEPDIGATVSVHTVPLLIAERCRLERNLVVDLLRREIWAFEEEGKHSSRLNAPISRSCSVGGDRDLSDGEADTIADRSPSWIHAMSDCPQGILDLLNSRACRGAIMFNDPLRVSECQVLITRLAQCVFPFQCAHGRPSMIPILDLRQPIGSDPTIYDTGTIDSGVNDDDKHGSNFVEAFQNQYKR